MNERICESYKVKLYLSGSYDDAIRACRQYVNDVGLCVTVERADYVYSYGMESGVVVGLLNYPRFPATKDQVYKKAEGLAIYLKRELCQSSVLIDDGETAKWLTTREVE